MQQSTKVATYMDSSLDSFAVLCNPGAVGGLSRACRAHYKLTVPHRAASPLSGRCLAGLDAAVPTLARIATTRLQTNPLWGNMFG